MMSDLAVSEWNPPEMGEDEDYVEYLGRAADYYRDNPPPNTEHLSLIECDAKRTRPSTALARPPDSRTTYVEAARLGVQHGHHHQPRHALRWSYTVLVLHHQRPIQGAQAVHLGP